MFTPRQLLGHLTLVEELNRLKPQILEELGEERGRAVVTYLQFALARAYLQQHANSRQQVILDLLHVWAAGTSDETLRKEGQTIVFGLK